METKNLNPGDKVKLTTRETWEGLALESHDPEVILLKLKSGYNIGIRESEILDVKILEKSKPTEKEKIELKKNPKLKNIAMIITGGTISSRLDSKTGGVISTDAEEILKIAPEISQIANIVEIKKPFMKWSENMSGQDWKKLAQETEKLLNKENIDGVIITHGTDFLHYSSSALAFSLQKLNKPVALTYSQRSIDRGSTDAALNLICSARYATSDIAEVAIIGHKNLNDNLCLAMPATKTRKMHTSRRDTFQTINDSAIAEISPNLKKEIKILKNFNARNKNKVKLDAKFSDKVAMVKIFPGQNPEILNFYKEKGYKGIILELSGLGHAPSKTAKFNWLPTIKKLSKSIAFFGTAQTLYGSLNPNVYSAGRELQKTGLTFLKDMLTETAFVKLSWVLAHSSWTRDKKVHEKMLTNFTNEFNEKIKFEF